MTSRSNVMKLENWGIVYKGDPYTAPELRQSMLSGKVYDDAMREDGTPITTSRIDNILEGIVTTGSGSQYLLGEVDPEYIKMYPDAIEAMGIDVE